MKKEKKPLKIRRREIVLILVSIMVLVLFFSGYSMGKGYSSTNIETNAKIAEPILIVENNPVIAINGKNEKEYSIIGLYDSLICDNNITNCICVRKRF